MYAYKYDSTVYTPRCASQAYGPRWAGSDNSAVRAANRTACTERKNRNRFCDKIHGYMQESADECILRAGGGSGYLRNKAAGTKGRGRDREKERMKKKTFAALTGMLFLALTAGGCGKSGDGGNGDNDVTQAWGNSNAVSGNQDSQQPEGAGSSIPLTPESDFTVTDTDNGVSIVYINIEGGDINIPPEIGGKTVTELGTRAFFCVGVTSVVIPESVTKIGESAFNLTYLEQVVIPANVTEIENYAFLNCKRLTSVTILGGITQLKEMTFSGCSVLTDVTLPDTLTEIGASAFADCKSLTSLVIPDGVISVDPSAFSGCTGLTVTYQGTDYAYDELDSLYGALDEAASVAPSYPPEEFFNVSDVEDGIKIHYARETVGYYYYNGEPGVVIIPEQIDGKTVVEIGSGVFVGFEYIVDLTIPDTVKRIGSSAFNGCGELVHITLPNGLTEMESYLFLMCRKLEEISIPPSVTLIKDGVFNMCDSLKTIYVPEGVTEIGYAAFAECPNLEMVILPDSLESLGNEAFRESENVTVTYRGVTYSYDELDALYEAVKGE